MGQLGLHQFKEDNQPPMTAEREWQPMRSATTSYRAKPLRPQHQSPDLGSRSTESQSPRSSEQPSPQRWEPHKRRQLQNHLKSRSAMRRSRSSIGSRAGFDTRFDRAGLTCREPYFKDLTDVIDESRPAQLGIARLQWCLAPVHLNLSSTKGPLRPSRPRRDDGGHSFPSIDGFFSTLATSSSSASTSFMTLRPSSMCAARGLGRGR